MPVYSDGQVPQPVRTAAAGELIEEALHWLGVYTLRQSIPDYDIESCLRPLGTLIDALNAAGYSAGLRVSAEFEIPGARSYYTIGQDGDFVTIRPERITRAWIRRGNRITTIGVSERWPPTLRGPSIHYSPEGMLMLRPAYSGRHGERLGLEFVPTAEAPELSESPVPLRDGWWDYIVLSLMERIASMFDKVFSLDHRRMLDRARMKTVIANYRPIRIVTADYGIRGAWPPTCVLPADGSEQEVLRFSLVRRGQHLTLMMTTNLPGPPDFRIVDRQLVYDPLTTNYTDFKIIGRQLYARIGRI